MSNKRKRGRPKKKELFYLEILGMDDNVYFGDGDPKDYGPFNTIDEAWDAAEQYKHNISDINITNNKGEWKDGWELATLSYDYFKWRGEKSKLKQQLENANTEIAQLKEQLEKANNEIAQLKE